MPNSRLRVEVSQKLLVDIGLLAILALFIGIITVAYISCEHNFHWWIDWYARTLSVATTFHESPLKALELVQYSLIGERNRLFTLPLIPFFFVFGSSRLVYELSLAFVYLLPFALIMGAIATQLIRKHQRTVFWATAFLTLLIPVNWIPTFMGIPDTGGAALLGLATFVYLQDVKLNQWWRIPLIGFFIGFSILLRRPFVYAGVTFVGAISVQVLMVFIAKVRHHFSTSTPLKQIAMAWQSLLIPVAKITLIAASALATVGIVAPQFTYTALTRDYKTLYTSWSLPFTDIFNLYSSFYGWGTWLLVVLGFSACLVTHTLPLPGVSFIGVSGVLSLFIWLVLLRYGNVFYSLQVTPLVIIGLVALIWTTWSRLRGKARRFMLGGIGCYLVVNLIVGLAPIGTMSRVFHPLFALNMPPLVRTDYDEVVRLLDTLNQLTPQGEPIFVVGHQRLQLTSGMLRAAEYILYPDEESTLNILQVPEVDSRDSYPLEELIEAEYVVIPSQLPAYSSDPTQIPVIGEWLPKKEHDVVNVVFDAFSQHWEFTQDFKRLPLKFNFENGVIVSIYQRIRPTSVATAVRTLEVMQRKIEQRPGTQKNWIILSQWVHNTKVKQNSYNTYEVVAFRRDQPWGDEEKKAYRISQSMLLAKELGLGVPNGQEALATSETSKPLPWTLPDVKLVRALRNQALYPTNSPRQSPDKRKVIPLVFRSSDAEWRQFDAAFAIDSPSSSSTTSLMQTSNPSNSEVSPEPKADRTQQLGTSLLYLGPVPNRAKVSGTITYIDQDCVGSFLRVAMLNSEGNIVSSTESAYTHKPQKVTQFELSLHNEHPTYLLFNSLSYTHHDLVNSCTIQIKPLEVSNQS